MKEAIANGGFHFGNWHVTSEASAEGPIMKKAHDHVLSNGGNLNDIINLVKDLRRYSDKIGIVLMGYIANLYKYISRKLMTSIKKAGADARFSS